MDEAAIQGNARNSDAVGSLARSILQASAPAKPSPDRYNSPYRATGKFFVITNDEIIEFHGGQTVARDEGRSELRKSGLELAPLKTEQRPIEVIDSCSRTSEGVEWLRHLPDLTAS